VSDNFLTQKLWFGITRWRWLCIFQVFMLAVVLYGFFLVQQNSAQDSQDSVNSDYKTCLAANDTRAVIRETVKLAVEGGDGIIDLTSIAGFEDLDRETQTFLINLRDETRAAAQAGIDNPDSLLNEAREVLAPRDCDAEFPDHS